MAYSDVVKREWEILSKSHLVWFVTLVLPLTMCILICLIFGKATPRNLPVAVLNNDNSKLSRLVIRNIQTLPSCRIKYYVTDLNEAKNLIIEGKAYAIIVIPKNFQRDILRQKQPKLVLYYNNQRLLIGGILSKDIKLVLKSMIIGIDAKMKSKRSGLPMDAAIKQANPINIVEHIRSNPYFNYMYLITLTAFGHILQIAMIMTTVWAIGTEFKFGRTKEWLKTADNSIVTAILGKMTPYTIIFFTAFFVIYSIYFVFYQAPFAGHVILGILGTLFFMFASFSLGIIFISINGNFRYCLSASAFYSAIGFALAGITFPIMSMPLVIKAYSATMPLTHWAEIILDQSIRKIPVIYDLKCFVPLICAIILAGMILPRLKSLALDEKRWFQA